MVMRPIRAGFVGFGEVNTPREIILRKCEEACKLLAAQGIELVYTAPVSDDAAGQDVARARKELSAAGDMDLLIACVAGWIPSHAVLNVIEPFKHKPVLLWGLSGWQEGGRFLTTADQAGTAALRKPMQDMGYTFKYVMTYKGKPAPVEAILSFARAARAAALLRQAKIGMMGYRDMRLYGTLYDGVSLKARIGPEIEHFEMLEMVQAMERLDPDEITRLSEEIRKRWTFTKTPRPGTVENTVRLYLALKGKARERGYEAMSLIDVDGIKKLLRFAPAGVFMLLHEEENLCTVPENDAMGAVTQLMVRYLTSQVGAYMEFYEFMEDGVLMGVPDYVPTEIVDGPVRVMPAAFGQFGEGLLNVSKVKTGRVTLARLTYTGDRYSMHLVTGQARTPSPWEEAGWPAPAPQLPSLEIQLDEPMEQFTRKVLSQHYIISYGDNRPAMLDLCGLLGVAPY
jgi:L-fucose isomerase-like protein